MTTPREHYALPAPTGALPADQLDLWAGDCARCEGSGAIRIAADEGDPTSRAACPTCGGSGVVTATRPRSFDWE